MEDLMIDLETLGTSPGAPVLSIGACFFDLDTGEIGEKFHQRIDAADALRYGKMSGDTFKWWMKQGDDARRKVTTDGYPAAVVFGEFDAFCRKFANPRNIHPWGNGSSFDITILDVSFPRILSKPCPWMFWNVNDVRTIVRAGKKAGHSYDIPREGTHHDALDDAIYQVAFTSFYWRLLTGPRTPPEAFATPAEPVGEADDFDLLG